MPQSFEAGDLAKSDVAVAAVVAVLDSIADSPPPDAEDVLAEIERFLSSRDSNEVPDFTLPELCLRLNQMKY